MLGKPKHIQPRKKLKAKTLKQIDKQHMPLTYHKCVISSREQYLLRSYGFYKDMTIT